MLDVVRTPLRVSLFGGGTDYPAYFKRFPGAVLGFAIDKYIYSSALKLSAYVDYRYRLSYSQVEHVEKVEDIHHPVVRELLKHYGFTQPVDFSFQSDLPASAGLGSSSAFTVGFVNLISRIMGIPRTRMEIARQAIFTEQVLLKENVGIQDQLHATFGGINRFDFHGDDYRISPINISGAALSELTSSMVLVYTNVKRRATQIVAEQVKNTTEMKVDKQLGQILELVGQAQTVLESTSGQEAMPARIGEMLGETWQIKKRLSSGVSMKEVDDLYESCIAHGAIGGKLCGAGGGGFLLMVVPPDRRASFVQAIGERRCISFRVDVCGTQSLNETGASAISGGQDPKLLS